MLYFEGLTTESDIKTRYKELAKKHHPDLGGCVEAMKDINTQYEKVITGAYQKAGKSITEIDDLLAQDLVLRNKLNAILCLDNLVIELCGTWLWVTGDTRTHKDKLKVQEFRWSNSKLAWYWRSEDKRSFNRKPMNLDEIRTMHGSHNVKRKTYASLA